MSETKDSRNQCVHQDDQTFNAVCRPVGLNVSFLERKVRICHSNYN